MGAEEKTDEKPEERPEDLKASYEAYLNFLKEQLSDRVRIIYVEFAHDVYAGFPLGTHRLYPGDRDGLTMPSMILLQWDCKWDLYGHGVISGGYCVDSDNKSGLVPVRRHPTNHRNRGAYMLMRSAAYLEMGYTVFLFYFRYLLDRRHWDRLAVQRAECLLLRWEVQERRRKGMPEDQLAVWEADQRHLRGVD